MKRADVLFTLAILIFATFFLWLTRSFPLPFEKSDVGSAAFPRLILVFLIILCLVNLLNLRKTINSPLVINNRHFVIILLTFYGAYIALTNILGYMVATVLFIITTLFSLGFRRWTVILLYLAGMISLLFFGFYRMVGIHFPIGLFM